MKGSIMSYVSSFEVVTSSRPSASICTSNLASHRGSCHLQGSKEEQRGLGAWCTLPVNCNRAHGRVEAVRCSASAVDAEVEEPAERATDIQFTDERRPKSNLLLTFTVPASRCTKAWEKALRVCAKGLDIPGFRPGKKIPENVIIREVGRERVVTEAMGRVMDACFGLILEKYKEQAFGDSVHILTEDKVIESFSKDKPFTFQATMDLYPTLSWKGDYKKLRVEVPDVSSEESDQEATKERIWESLKQKGKLRVADSGLEKGDVAIIDFSARRAETGETIAGSEKRGMQVDTMDEDAVFGIEGIVPQLIGKRPGDSVKGVFDVSNTWWEQNEDTARLDCTVDVKEVLTWDVPELTDELAKELLPGCSGVDDLWSQLIEAQRQFSKADLAQNVNTALLDAVADLIDCEVPEFMILNMAQHEYQKRLLEYQSMGKLDAEAINQLATEELLVQFMQRHYEAIEQMQKGVLAIEAIFREEGMTVSEEDMRREAQKTIEEAKQAKEDLDEEKLMEQIYEVLKANMVLQFLVDVSDIDIVGTAEPVAISDTTEATEKYAIAQ